MSLKKMLVLVGSLLVVAVVLAACGSAVTPTAAPVVTEAPTEAPTAVPTVDPTIAIQAAFDESGHTDDTSMVFHDWDESETKEVPATCAKCHSELGYVDFITNGKVSAGVPAPQGVFTCNLCHNDVAKGLTSVTFLRRSHREPRPRGYLHDLPSGTSVQS